MEPADDPAKLVERRSGGQTEHGFVVSRDRLEFRLAGRLERPTSFPGVLPGGYRPEPALAVQHDPVLRAPPVHIEAQRRLPGRGNGTLAPLLLAAVSPGRDR